MDKYTSTLLPQDNTKEENQKAILDLLNKLNETIQEVNNQKNILIPIGFEHVQRPGTPEPSVLWPFATWANVSSSYPGAFFRVEGGNASTFGSGVQNDAGQGHRHLESLQYNSAATYPYGTAIGASSTDFYLRNAIAAGTTHGVLSDPVTDGVNGTPRTANETRPLNYTVRIWRRTA